MSRQFTPDLIQPGQPSWSSVPEWGVMRQVPSIRAAFAAAISCAVLLGAANAQSAPDYEYSGVTGPSYWQETPGWETCGRSTEAGARQTPIDIRSATYDRSLQPLNLSILPTPLRFKNTSHTVEQEYEPGSYIVVGGVSYNLLQFHFHTLSEHGFAGRRGALELHAVFRNPSTGQLVVIGQIFDLGRQNRFIADLLADGVPVRAGEVISSEREINVTDAFTNTRAYFTYAGSLTTPPCSETVTWFVLQDRGTVSEAQYAAINSVVGNNFRPFQALNRRTVRSSRPGSVAGPR